MSETRRRVLRTVQQLVAALATVEGVDALLTAMGADVGRWRPLLLIVATAAASGAQNAAEDRGRRIPGTVRRR